MRPPHAQTETWQPASLPTARDAIGPSRAANPLALPSPNRGAARAGLRGRTQASRRTTAYRLVAVWFFRALLITPFVFMGPEVVAAMLGRPDAVAHISASTADVLGSSAFLVLVMMLAVTPVHTMTGWRWHVILRRDYGVALFAVAGTDLTLAAVTTGDTFPGGVLTRIGGHSFLLAGLTSTLLLVPMALTANRRAQRWLGGYWKRIQQLTYVVWATVLIHLLLLFGVGTIFIDAVAVSVPLVILRVPRMRRWWSRSRRSGSRRLARCALAAALIGIFAVGYVPLVHEFATKGAAAFNQRPGND